MAFEFARSEFGFEIASFEVDDILDIVCNYFEQVIADDAKYEHFMSTCKKLKQYEGYDLAYNKQVCSYFKSSLKHFATNIKDWDRRKCLTIAFKCFCMRCHQIKYESGKLRTWDF